MLIKSPPSWILPESAATPEDVYLNRRTLLKGLMGTAAAGAALSIGGSAFAQQDRAEMAAMRNNAFEVNNRPLTPEDVNIQYNNFYEYGSHKSIAEAAEKELEPRPWQIEIDGLCANPMVLDVDELIGMVDLEERVYRHRCVEAWSMVVPWIGFPVAKLLALAEPQSSAKYLRMETFGDPGLASGIASQPWYPWPYTESITMEEAANELPLLVVGAYGKQVANSMGAPIRLHLPWKFGFKSLKSIVKFSFVEERPIGYWEQISIDSNNEEYGFWANVNPEVPHPRWSQARETILHTREVVPTLLFNGYGEQVADLYAGMEGEQLYR